MKKSSFTALMLGTVSGVLFALGFCMALIPEWNAFKPGIVFGSVGLLLGLITYLLWRKMEHKNPIQISGKTLLTLLTGILGALTLGIGMCFSMVWGRLALGIGIGLTGIVILLWFDPLDAGNQRLENT